MPSWIQQRGQMMNRFFCLKCSRTSFLVERFCCIHCGNGEFQTAVAENLNLQVPEPENVSPGNNVPATDAGNQKSEEGFKLVKPPREANTHMFEENSDFPLQIAGRNGYENCPKSESPSQNKTPHAFDQYNNENQTRLPANSNINEGECHDPFYAVGYAGTLVEAPAASQQTYLSEESTVPECENRNNSDELLRRQGIKEPTEHGLKSDSFVFTDSISLESEYPVRNLLSDSSDKIEDRQDKDNTAPSFSSCPRGNPSVNKCFQENLVTASGMAQQKPQTSGKLSRRWCENCGRYFTKKWTFIAHMKDYCNLKKTFKCKECGDIFPNLTKLLIHQRLHTGEKPFKCNQCDFASARKDNLNNHMKKHAEERFIYANNSFFQRFS